MNTLELENMSNLRKRFVEEISLRRIGKLLCEYLYKEIRFDFRKDFFPILKGKNLNLKSGEVIHRSEDDYFTHECGVIYNPKADSSAVMPFLREIMCYDDIMLSNLQKILGYCITGEIFLIKGFYFIGDESSGISILVEMVSKILGSGCMKIPKLSHPGVQNRVISSNRLIICESNEDYNIKLDNVKQIILCNNEPTLLLEGFICFKFPTKSVDIPKNKNEFVIEKNIMKTLEQDDNKSAFLNWLIEGAQIYYNGKFP
jgi:phage/plasmid-associated DNA primase